MYIKTNTIFCLSKYYCIRIDKNILGMNSLFFYENQKFRSQAGPFVNISDFFKGVKVKFFRFISKQIPYLVSLNTLVLELIKISSELIVYFSKKIKNSNHRGRWSLCIIFQIFFEGVNVNFFRVLSKKLCI